MRDLLHSDVLRATMIGRKLMAGSPESVANDVKAHGTALQRAIADMGTLEVPDTALTQVKNAKSHLDTYIQMSQMVSAKAVANPDAAVQSVPEFTAAFTALEKANGGLSRDLDQSTIAFTNAASTQRQSQLWLLGLMFGGLSALVIGLGLAIQRSIEQPLERARLTLEKIGPGRL